MPIDTPENLTPAQRERLSILMEECSEVIQMVGKILRFGYESKYPNRNDALTNKERIEDEIRDVLAIIQLMTEHVDLDANRLASKGRVNEKLKKIRKWTSYQHST